MEPMLRRLSMGRLGGAVVALLVGSMGIAGCTTGDDGTPTVTPTATPDTATPTPNEPTPPAPVTMVTISGTVSAVDRETGAPLDAATFAQRSGRIVVYALPDPSDLTHPLSKSTLDGPGFYSMEVPENSGELYMIAVADVDSDTVITGEDLLREAALSPVAVATTATENVDIVLDLTPRGGGGGGPLSYAPISGNVLYNGVGSEAVKIAVVAFRGDYSGRTWGKTERVSSGDYNLSVAIYGDKAGIAGYADVDGNALYEPCDPAGLAEDLVTLGTAGATGVDILIEGVGPSGLPRPIPYITLSGTVSGGDAYAGAPIVVSARAANSAAVVGSVTLAAPGNFSMRLPGNLGSVVVSAISDTNGDNVLDAALDANGSAATSVGTSSVGGVSITLVQPVYDTGLSGIVSYSGSVAGADRVVMALFDEGGPNGQDPMTTQVMDPIFPLEYSFLELEPGTYYVLGMLDVDGNWLGGAPGADDVVGAYTLNGSTLLQIIVEENQVTTGINFTLGNYTL